MAAPRFIYGTAGWSYADWVGPFYPAGTSDRDFLQHYATRFPGVEVDSTYYRTPTVRTTEAWARCTPDAFMFSPKMVGEVTHERFLRDCSDILDGYLQAMKPLGEKLGPIVLQFPYFKKDSGVTLDALLERLLPFLDALPRDYRFAVEVRNKAFLKPKLLDALRQRQTALVLVDHVWMPAPAEYERSAGIFTSDYVPIRLLGDRYGIEKITQKWGEIVIDQSARVAAWARLIRRALATKLDVQVFVNNHYAGHGPRSALELAEAVEAGDASAGTES